MECLIFSDPRGFVSLGDVEPLDGQPRKRYAKDVLRVGDFVKASTGQTVTITPARLQHFVNQFQAMSQAGIKVPVPVDHSDAVEDNRGWVTNLWVDDDRLMAELELVGEDALKLPGRSEISVRIVPDLPNTEAGKPMFEDVIDHVSIVSQPVISRQHDWRSVAASRDLYQHSTEKENAMPEDKNDDVLLSRLAERLELGEVSDIDALADAIAQKLDAANRATTEATEKVTEVEAELSRRPEVPAELGETERLLSSRLIQQRADQIVESGAIDRSTMTKLLSMSALSSDVALSAKGGKIPGEELLIALSGNKPMHVGENTNRQIVPQRNEDAAKSIQAKVQAAYGGAK